MILSQELSKTIFANQYLFSLYCSQEMPVVVIEEEVKADNINDAIKSVIKKS